jgi:regulator of protease activity HflC (stomatin/prohibitin superfamily)
MVNSYEVYDTKVQQDKITTSAYSKDGQTMVLEVFLQYQIQSENVVKIATEYGNLDALQARIETVTIEKTKAVMSSAEAMTIIQNRSQFSNSVSASVREGISDDYYVNVKDVVLTNIDFTNEFERSVEDKVIAEQEKQAAITRAEAELEVAKLEAQKKIEEARGNAEAQKIIAQASAEAATYNIVELAKTVGYTVNETYLYSVEGAEREFAAKQAESETTIYLGTKYVIDLTSGPGQDQFKVLVEDYLKYLAYLEKWNGELPDVVSGDDALSIIVPNS